MEQKRRALSLAFAIAVAAVVASASARADDDAAKAIAQPLFDDGVKLMDEGHCDDESIPPAHRPVCRDALAKFVKAFEIYPAGLGALRNAALCERGLGMFASATRDFRELARRAPLDPNPSKQLWAKHATEEADKLGKLVPHLQIKVEGAPAVRVKLDGVEVPKAAFGVPIPVDPGDHVVEAEAPQHVGFRKQMSVEPKEDATVVVRLVPVAAPLPPPPRSYALPITLVTVGAVGVGTGLALGWAAKKNRDDACDGSLCHDASGLDRARHFAVGSTIATGIGAALVVSGVVVLVVRAGGRAREVAVVASPGGATVAGAF